MRKSVFLFSLLFSTVTLAIDFNAPQRTDTWANWEKRLDRVYKNSFPRHVPGRAMGIIVPSDPREDILPLSAFGYEILARESFNVLIVLMPAPPEATFDGFIIPNLEFLDTSFGSFPVDTLISSTLLKSDLPIRVDNFSFYPDIPAILQTQLANLKYVFKSKIKRMKILPIMVHLSDVNSDVKDYAPQFADRIRNMGMEIDVAFVVAGDFATGTSEDALVAEDSSLLSATRILDVESVIKTQQSTAVEKGQIKVPDLDILSFGILALSWMGADHAEVLAYGHSGQLVLTKDKSKPTGYASIAFASGPPNPPKIKHIRAKKMIKIFGDHLRTDILAMTRQTCALILSPVAAEPPPLPHKQAKQKWPVYVSLYDPEGHLAGQSGTHKSIGPLEESIKQFSLNAVRAAQPGLTNDNFKDYAVDISIPYGFTKVSRPDELIPFLHGVVVHRKFKQSATHPDAWRTYSDPHLLLGSICHKLGMTPWAYATRQATMESFRILSFNDKEPFQDLGIGDKRRKKKNGPDEELLPGEEGGNFGGGGLFPF